MTGSGFGPRGRGLAAIALAFIVTLGSLVPGAAEADAAKAGADRADFVRAMNRERSVLAESGNARISQLALSTRPKARADADVTVASRSVAPASGDEAHRSANAPSVPGGHR